MHCCKAVSRQILMCNALQDISHLIHQTPAHFPVSTMAENQTYKLTADKTNSSAATDFQASYDVRSSIAAIIKFIIANVLSKATA